LAAERLAVIEPFAVFMTTMVYEPFVPSSPPESIDPSAAEHPTITVIAVIAVIAAMTAMTAAAATAVAAVAAVAALRYFALRIIFLPLPVHRLV
jgi:quinolinate synthase